MIPEHLWRSTGTAAAAIEDDIVRSGFQCKLNIPLYMVGTELKTYRDSATALPNPISEVAEIGDAV